MFLSDRKIYVFFLVFLFFSNLASAYFLNGYVDINYSHLDTTSKSEGSNETEQESDDFRHQYNFNINKNIFPQIRLLANTIFEQRISRSRFDGELTDSKTTIVRPLIDLTLRDKLYTAGISYNRKSEKNDTDNSPGKTNINEEYNTVLGWKPVGLPSLDMRYKKTNTFDKRRSDRDVTDDFYQVFSIYEPINNLKLRYQGDFDNTEDKISKIEQKNISHSGKGALDLKFFKDRVSFYSSYDISRRSTETIFSDLTSGVAGEGKILLSPFAGLTGLDDTPLEGSLNSIDSPSPQLIDGDTSTVVASSEVNIGFVAGDRKLRNLGIDFSIKTEVDTIYVWVNRELPSKAASYFFWDIYISDDNENWTLWDKASSPAVFGPFENRFIVKFPAVETRYIKLVVKPLSESVAFSIPFFEDTDKIFITEIQSFITISSTSNSKKRDKFVVTSQFYNADGRVRIFDTPYVYYEISYFLSKSDGIQSNKKSNLSNGISINHNFWKIFTGNARFAREDIEDNSEKSFAYVYNASLNATPLPTLYHNLSFNKRYEKNSEGKTDRNSVVLYNNVELYKGLNAFVSGGYSFSTFEDNTKQVSNNFDFGANIIPHPSVNININYSASDSEKTGGGIPESSTYSKRSELLVSYRPFSTLYLVGSWSKLSDSGAEGRDITQRYSVNWAPFPNGQLQFGFQYDEEKRTIDNQLNKLIRPSLRWNLSPSTYLDISYLIIESDSDFTNSESKVFSVNLRISF